jgi:hypothetical protein
MKKPRLIFEIIASIGRGDITCQKLIFKVENLNQQDRNTGMQQYCKTAIFPYM